MHARKHSLETTRLECFQYDKTFAEKKLSHTTLIRHTLDKKITSAQNVKELSQQGIRTSPRWLNIRSKVKLLRSLVQK